MAVDLWLGLCLALALLALALSTTLTLADNILVRREDVERGKRRHRLRASATGGG